MDCRTLSGVIYSAEEREDARGTKRRFLEAAWSRWASIKKKKKKKDEREQERPGDRENQRNYW